MNDELNERTEKQLALQNIGLLEIRELLNKEGLTWFISGGTLLGAAREGDYIKWDWDVDLALLTEEIMPRRESFESLLQSGGFKILRKNRSYENLKYVAEKYNAEYEFLAWHKRGNMRCRRIFKRPARFFENPGTIKLRGEEYPCPTPLEEYLEFVYGDWRTPKKSLNKEEYFSNKNLRGIKLLRIARKQLGLLKRRILNK